jgi:hypothetical protein
MSPSSSSKTPGANDKRTESDHSHNVNVLHRSETVPLTSYSPALDPTPVARALAKTARDPDTHGFDLPWITHDLGNSASTSSMSPDVAALHGHRLTRRLSDLNLSAHHAKHAHTRRTHTRPACFVHSLLQSTRSGSPSRAGSGDEGSGLEVLTKGPKARDRWSRGMTKKELSDIALGVRELSKRLGS